MLFRKIGMWLVSPHMLRMPWGSWMAIGHESKEDHVKTTTWVKINLGFDQSNSNERDLSWYTMICLLLNWPELSSLAWIKSTQDRDGLAMEVDPFLPDGFSLACCPSLIALSPFFDIDQHHSRVPIAIDEVSPPFALPPPLSISSPSPFSSLCSVPLYKPLTSLSLPPSFLSSLWALLSPPSPLLLPLLLLPGSIHVGSIRCLSMFPGWRQWIKLVIL